MSKNETLLKLTNELSKKNGSSQKINQWCQELEIPYNGNQIDLMTYILGSNILNNISKDIVTKNQKKNDFPISK